MADYKILVGTELKTDGINTALRNYKGNVNVGTILDISGITTAINAYKAKAITVDTLLNTDGITEKIRNYKPPKMIHLESDLSTVGIDNKINNYAPKQPIRVDVELTKSSINQQIRDIKPSETIKVNAELDNGAVTKAIRDYKATAPIRVMVDPDFSEAATKISNYQMRNMLKVNVKLNKTLIDSQIKNFQTSSKIQVGAQLRDNAIETAIRTYAGKELVPITVDFKVGNTNEITNKINEYKNTTVPIFAKLQPAKTGFDSAIMNKPVRIQATLEPEDINKVIEGFVPTSRMKVDVRLEPKDINGQVAKLPKPATPLNVDVELNNDSVNSAILAFKSSARFNVGVDLKTDDINKQIDAIQPTSKVNVRVNLDNSDIDEKTGKQSVQKPITVNVKLNTEKINEQINGFKTQSKVAVGVKLDFASHKGGQVGIPQQIKDYKTSAKIKVGVQLDKDDITQQIGQVKVDSPIQLGVELDPKGIQNVEKQIDNLRDKIQALGNISINLGGGSGRASGGGTGSGGNGGRAGIPTGLIEADIKIDNLANSVTDLQSALKKLGFNDAHIGAITQDFNELDIAVKNVTTRLDKKGNLSLTVKGVDKYERAVKAMYSVGEKGGLTSLGTSVSQSFKETEAAFARLKTIANQMKSLKVQRVGLDTEKDKQRITELTSQIDKLKAEYSDLFKITNQNLTSSQLDALKQKSIEAGRAIKVAKAAMADKTAYNEEQREIKETRDEYQKLIKIANSMKRVKVALAGLDPDKDKQRIAELTSQLKNLQTEYKALFVANKGNFDTKQLDALKQKSIETGRAVKEAKAAMADDTANLAKGIRDSFSGYDAKVKSLKAGITGLSQPTKEVTKAFGNVEQAWTDMKNASNNDELIAAEERYQTALKETEAQLKINQLLENQPNEDGAANDFAIKKEAALIRISNLFENGSQAANRFGAEARELVKELNSVGNADGIDRVNAKIANLEKRIKKSNLQTKTFGTRLKDQFSKYSQYLSIASIFMYATQAARSMFEQVKLIDSAMTELKKVTDETNESYDRFLSSAASRAREIGTTIDGLVSSTADFARLGYGFEDAQGLAEVANIYAVVGDEIDGVEGATQSLVSTMAAFKSEMNDVSNTDFAMGIVDKMNEVSNNFAISSGGLGEALQRSASSMAAANNTLDETIAMITAANEVAQNPEKVGNAMKTMSMRIRGAKTELEEAGESTEGMAKSTASLRQEMLALSGVDIMLNENTFKSTYQIMDELSKKWEDLSDIQQATIIELVAGKHQGNVFSSLMANFETARKALDTSLNSSGSAMKEHAKWSESLEARLNKLKAAWQGLSQAFMNSNFLKNVLDGVINLVDGLTKLIDKVGALPVLLSVFAGLKVVPNLFGKIGATAKTAGGGIKSLSDVLSLLQLSFPKVTELIGKFIASLKKGDDGTRGFTKSLKGIFDALKQHWIIAVVVAAITILGGIFGHQAKEAEKLAKKVEELTEKYKEQHEELKKIKNDYDTSNESSMISKYERLSKGVDNLGRNVSLTADEYSEYQSIVNQIAEQFPSLVSGYDEQGNALLTVKGNVEALTEAYQKLIHTQNQDILTSTGDIEKDFENTLQKSGGKHWWSNGHGFWAGLFGNGADIISRTAGLSPVDFVNQFGSRMLDYELKTDTAKSIQDLLNAASESEKKKILNKLRLDRFADEELRDLLPSAGFEVGFFESPIDALEKALEEDPAKLQEVVNNYYAQFAEVIEKQKTIAQAKLSEAFDVSSAISGLNYDNISEELQNVAHQTVNSLDLEFFEGLQEEGKTVEQWTTEMLDQLNSISSADNAQIDAAFDLQTKFNGGEISYGEYVSGLEDTGKLIEKLNLKPELESQLKLSLGLDEDGLVAGFKQLKNRLASDEYFDIMPSDYAPFIKDLSSEELSVLWKIIPELEETDYRETIDDVKNALRREMIVQGLTFDLNLEVEFAGIEALNTALAESVSATGLSSESIAALKGRYSELELQGYDLSSMFEETSTGIRINRQEISKLEKAYATQKLDEVNGDLAEMKAEYDRLGEELKTCGDEAKAGIYNDRLTLAQKISDAATLAAQYEGLTNAYNDWLSAEEAGQERDMYENIIKGFETVDDEISRGWIDDAAIEFLELLTGRTDLAGKSGKQLKEIYDELDETIGNSGYSIRDFFTVNEDGDSTNTGVYNFLETVESFEDKLGNVIERKDGNIVGFNFEVAGGDEVIAETLGISKELVQIMVRAADDAGFVVSMDGTYRQLADLQNEAKAAADYLHEIGKTDFEFDFNTSSIESLNIQLNEAYKILDDPSFWNKDGTFNFNADGAQQAMDIVGTLQAKLDYLTQEKYGIGLTVEDEEFEEPLENLQNYGRKVATLNQLELNPKANAEEIEKINGELEGIAKYFAELDNEKKVKIGLVTESGKTAFTEEYFNGLSKEKKIEIGLVNDKGEPLTDYIDAVQKKIESGEVEIPTVLDIQTNMDKNLETLADLALLDSNLLSASEEETIRKKYNVEAEADKVDASDVEEKVESTVIDGLGNPMLSRGVNIEIIAETLGIEDVDDLSSKLEGLDDATVQAIAEAIGQSDVEALDIAIAGMDGNTVDAVCNALGYDSLEELKAAIRNMQGNAVDAEANTDGQAEKVWTLQDVIDGLKGKVVDVVVNTIKTVKTVVENGASAGKKVLNDRFGIGGVNGTANVNGTTGRAFRQGSWGTKNSGTALVGELGTETLVRDGRYYTIGDAGAEFIKYKKGDIIFNHRQTEELFANGKVTSGGGRGKAFAEGTAFSVGSGGIGKVIRASAVTADGEEEVKTITESSIKKTVMTKVTKGKKKGKGKKKTATKVIKNEGGSTGSEGEGGVGRVDASNSSESSTYSSSGAKDEFEETIDWIEIAISRIEREVDNLDKKANNVYKSWSSRNEALASEINKVGDEIELQESAYNRYMQEANSVGLSSSWASKVRNGEIDIETIKDEALAEKIKEYQQW